MSILNLPPSPVFHADWPPLEVAIFHLQDVCVYVQSGMHDRLRTAGLEKAPEIEATFRWLSKRKIRIILLSDFDREQTAILLERLGWAVGPGEIVECVVIGQQLCINPVQRALEAGGALDPRKAVVVVDTPELLRSAHAAQIHFNLGVTSGRCSYHTLQSADYLTLLDTPLQLVNFLLNQLPSLAEVKPVTASPN